MTAFTMTKETKTMSAVMAMTATMTTIMVMCLKMKLH
jgi:hypothetical protein